MIPGKYKKRTFDSTLSLSKPTFDAALTDVHRDSRNLHRRTGPTGYVIGIYLIHCMIITETGNGVAEGDTCLGSDCNCYCTDYTTQRCTRIPFCAPSDRLIYQLS